MASVPGSVIRVDEQELRGHLDEVVRTSVEEMLNGLLDAEADQLCRAARYERTADRLDMRAGSYERKLVTKAGEVKLKVPRLRRSCPPSDGINERRPTISVDGRLVVYETHVFRTYIQGYFGGVGLRNGAA